MKVRESPAGTRWRKTMERKVIVEKFSRWSLLEAVSLLPVLSPCVSSSADLFNNSTHRSLGFNFFLCNETLVAADFSTVVCVVLFVCKFILACQTGLVSILIVC